MTNYFWIFSVVFAIAISILLIALLLRAKSARGKTSLFSYAGSLLGVSLLVVLISSVNNFQTDKALYFCIGLTFAFLLMALTILLVFFLEYTNRLSWLSPINILVLGLQPTLTFCALWFGPSEWSYRSISNVLYFGGPWMWMVYIYGQFLVFFSIIIFIRVYQAVHPIREWSRLVVLGFFAVLVIQELSLLNIPVRDYLALYLAALSVMGLIIAYVFLFSGFLGMIPISRETAIEKMPDGWTIINNQNRILDLNNVAESIVGDREHLIGKDVRKIFSNWDTVLEGESGEVEVQLQGRVMSPDQKRVYSLTAIPINEPYVGKIGWLVLWRDVTLRLSREQSRRRAQNEMFGLLYSISAAGGRAQNLDNFFNATMQDVMRVFKCHPGIVFLADKDGAASSELFLAVQYGLSTTAQNKMYSISKKDPLMAAVIRTHEPQLVQMGPSVVMDKRVAESMWNSLNGSLALIPMLSEDLLIGVMCLMREASQPFTKEELSNITIVAEQVANFVSGDRRRQLAIVLAERQKLVRDLHDSVTQKLYGLVALTEAAKSGLETGSTETMVQVLPRISDNARQALKEMRLFVYGLQPVDIEREGLESAIQQRLAAVEGRANVKARFISDENINLPIEKQVALYFIAQEALNNVLKHANASSVTLNLTQNESNIFFEISDDGNGATPTQLKGGGMGLKNMHYRATQIGGKLKLTSIPGKGTQIKVTLSKESRD